MKTILCMIICKMNNDLFIIGNVSIGNVVFFRSFLPIFSSLLLAAACLLEKQQRSGETTNQNEYFNFPVDVQTKRNLFNAMNDCD